MPPLAIRLATTKGTNALLEEKGAKVALFITAGFADLLQIGSQQRPDLFALKIEKPNPMYQTVVEVPERLSAHGKILRPLQIEPLEKEVERLLADNIPVAAVSLMHSYRNPVHERQLADFLRCKGFKFVTCSSDLAQFIKLLPRTETTVVNAYLLPLMNQYLGSIDGALAKETENQLYIMTSAGGLISGRAYHPKDSLLSGPAGGVVGAVAVGQQSGLDKLITFDMGGTSTDVSRFEIDFEYAFERKIGPAHLVAPSLKIETVAAGGGSICGFDGESIFVGPQSAGAFPGPACYGANGPLTMTDVNILSGRLDWRRFGIPIHREKAACLFQKLHREVAAQRSYSMTEVDLLQGFLDIANERMADAIRKISVREGYDPKEYSLVAFGGAGGQHACAIADLLGIKVILCPHDAGILSALGLGKAVVERFVERQVLQLLVDVENRINHVLAELSGQAEQKLKQEGFRRDDIFIRRKILNLRLSGQDSVLSIEFNAEEPIQTLFEERYRSLFGYFPEGKSIEVESIRVVASTKPAPFEKETFEITSDRMPDTNFIDGFFGRWQETPVFNRDKLQTGLCCGGPAIVQDRFSTVVIEPGWQMVVGSAGSLLLNRSKAQVCVPVTGNEINVEISASRRAPDPSHRPVELELFTNRFRTIVEEMGLLLQRTALSNNIKERLDFSCALLDAQGLLVANAPHIPVHLGALGICVRSVINQIKPRPGDMIVTNHPAFGGSHLPDVTLIQPVFYEGQLIGYVANRAHHAEIGGVRPGSMPPRARHLIEEGVVIPPLYLYRQG
ncbi:MAG: 5-oxoprolinase, partial [Planctomycetes bacterium]|nr:5-oxoprolinase [Planctomycetota bacterium]